MDLSYYLSGMTCSCGRQHTCPIRHVLTGEGAIARLEEIVSGDARILLVADENTYRAAGKETRAALGGRAVSEVIFPGSPLLIPDEAAAERVAAALGDSTLILGVGSGVIQDLCKYVSLRSGLPYMVVATAPSMDGYASSGAAMILGGMKVTVAAGLPLALILDTAVLAAAPREMILAGYGDIIGKYSALSDWRLSEIVLGEYFCRTIYDITLSAVKRTEQLAAGIAARDPEAITALAEALVLVGIMMSFAGSSRPASGSEHHLSHFFEITGLLRGEEYLPHGIDVAFSAVEMARLHEAILARPFPRVLHRESEEEREAALDRVYGRLAPSCRALQEKAGGYRDRLSVYLERESDIRTVLADMPSSEELLATLRAVGLDKAEYDTLYGDGRIADAIRYAKDLKDRYTVLWLAYDLFGGFPPRVPTPRELTDAGICPTCYNREMGGVLYGDDRETLIYRDSLIECFFVDKPRAPGHVAILSVAHYQDMSEAPDDLNAYMMRSAAALGRILPRVFGCVRVYLASMCDGPSNHYHLQLIPRYPHEERGSDNLVKPRGRYVYDEEKLRTVSEMLRREMEG